MKKKKREIQNGPESAVYNADSQPIKDKLPLSMILGLFISFNLLFFVPFDFYLANFDALMLPQVYLFTALIPTAVLGFLAVTAVCFFTKGKAHIITCSVVFGLGLALYVQSNFLSLGLGALDGTKYSPGIVRCVINLAVWGLIIAVPFIVYRKNQPLFMKFISFVGAAILLVEIIAFAVTYFRVTTSLDVIDERTKPNLLRADFKTKTISVKDEFTFSNSENFLIIVADEYDAGCFDYTRENAPETLYGFDGFTYYPNTLGMYKRTHAAVSNILTGEHKRVEEVDYANTALFDALKKKYRVNLYSAIDVLTDEVNEKYNENYIETDVSAATIIKLEKCFYRLTMYKSAPDALKGLFYIYTDDFFNVFSDVSTFNDENLAFYDSLRSEVTFVDEPCFKYIHIYGLHDPRHITADLQEAEPWSVSGDEQAVAVNKILSAYFELLQENGVYENARIILLADHGIKTNNDGKHPMFLMKEPGDTFEELKINNAPVSYDDLYPTLMYLAGEDTGKTTVFDLKEGQQRERYFAETDEYITEDIK